MSRTKRNSPFLRELVEERRDGRQNRAKTWSPNGDKRDQRRERRREKQRLRDWD